MSSVKNLAQLFESIQSSSHSSLPTPPPSPYPYRQKKNNVTEVKSQEKEKKAKPLDLIGVNRKKLIEGLKLQLSSSKMPSDVKASTKEHEYTLDKEKSTVNANEGETHSPLDPSEERNKKIKLESGVIVKELSSPPKTHRSSELDLDTKNLGENSPIEIVGNVNEESPKPSSMAQNLGNPTPVIEELPKEKQTSPESKKKTEYLTNVKQQLSILVARGRASFESCKKKTGEQVQNMKEIGIKCCTSTKETVVEACSSSSRFLRKLPKVYARSFQIYCSSTTSTAKIALSVLLTSFICSLHPTVPRGSTPLLSFMYVQASTKVSFNYLSSFSIYTRSFNCRSTHICRSTNQTSEL